MEIQRLYIISCCFSRTSRSLTIWRPRHHSACWLTKSCLFLSAIRAKRFYSTTKASLFDVRRWKHAPEVLIPPADLFTSGPSGSPDLSAIARLTSPAHPHRRGNRASCSVSCCALLNHICIWKWDTGDSSWENLPKKEPGGEVWAKANTHASSAHSEHHHTHSPWTGTSLSVCMLRSVSQALCFQKKERNRT